MYDNFTELTIEGLTRGTELQEAYILVLRECHGDRFYPVLLSKEGYEEVAAAIKKKQYTSTRLMNKFAHRMGFRLTGIRLIQPHNGHSQALLDFTSPNETASISAPAAYAAVASLETGVSIWVNSEAFEWQSKHTRGGQSISLPLQAMHDELLAVALKAAVEEENYELAKNLRDEIRKRQQPNGENHSA